MSSEDRYEAIHLIIKSPTTDKENDSWFDRIFDFVTEGCEVPPENPGDDYECPCGMQSMGGSGGTLDQCYAYESTVGKGLQPIDLAQTIISLLNNNGYSMGEDDDKVIEWARSEIEFEERWANWTPSDEEDEGEDFRELTIDQQEG